MMRTRTSLLFLILMLLCGTAWATDYTQDSACKLAWLFGTGSGTSAVDSSVVGTNTGTFKSSGHPAWSSIVPNAFSSYSVNYALNDYITASNADSLNVTNVTLIFWSKPSGTKQYAHILDKWTSYFNAYEYQNNLKFTIWTGASGKNLVTDGGQFTTGGWHHCASTYDGSISRIYIAGSSVKDSASGWSGNIDTSSNNIWCGRYEGSVDNDDYNYDGLLTEVAIFNRALSSTEINDIMNNGLVGGTTVTGQIISVNVT